VKRGSGGRPVGAFSFAAEAPSFTPASCVAGLVYACSCVGEPVYAWCMDRVFAAGAWLHLSVL
jgi:hypothetical protein